MKTNSCRILLAGAGTLLLGAAFMGTDAFEAEPNDTAATANDLGVVSVGFLVSANHITAPGGAGMTDDWFTFTLPDTGSPWTIETLPDYAGLGDGIADTRLFLYSDAGTTLVTSDDDGGLADPDTGFGLSNISGIAPGTYWVNNSGFLDDDAATGVDYFIRFSKLVPEIQACCFDDQTCQDMLSTDCIAQSGTPQGSGSTCATTTCPDPLAEACCFNDQTCQDLLPGDCNGQGGTPQGPGSTCLTTSCPFPDLVSPDGLWRAQLDTFGQVENLFTPDQPASDNVFETLVYAATTDSLGLSQRLETAWTITDGPTASLDGTSSSTRFENGTLAVEVKNQMVDGPTGGVRVTMTCINKGTAPANCKLFYYVDFDISGTIGDDEALVILNKDGGVRAIEQDDFLTPGIKPLWMGGCKPYKSWSITTFLNLRAALDAGTPQLDGLDTTAPGAADHTCGLSGESATLLPGESVSLVVGIGGVNFDDCSDAAPCPWDLNNDGVVNAADLAILLGQWNNPYGPAELAALLGAWGPC